MSLLVKEAAGKKAAPIANPPSPVTPSIFNPSTIDSTNKALP